MNIVTKIAENINKLVGKNDWSSDNPFVIKLVNSLEKKAYIYKLRKGEDWITIEEIKSHNPRAGIFFNLRKKEGSWEYSDPSMIKYGKSSLTELLSAYNRLKQAFELPKLPKKQKTK